MSRAQVNLRAATLTRRISRPVIALLVAVATVVCTAGTAQAAVWGSSGQWASWSNNGYTLYNDVWGSGAGPQSIWANSYRNWGVWSNQPNTGGVKSYPDVSKWVGTPINSLNSVTSGYDVSVPSSGAYESAYDIWDSSNSNEIMLWMNQTGPVGAIGSYVTTVWLGGYNWNVHKGWNGNNNVYSFLNTGTLDVGNRGHSQRDAVAGEQRALDRQRHAGQCPVRLGDHLLQRWRELHGQQLLGVLQLTSLRGPPARCFGDCAGSAGGPVGGVLTGTGRPGP